MSRLQYATYPKHWQESGRSRCKISQQTFSRRLWLRQGEISDSSEYLNEVVDVLRIRMMDLFLLLKDVAECRTVWNELLQAPVLLLRMGARLSVSGTLVQRQVATMWSSYLH
jgi:hypothetical protein